MHTRGMVTAAVSNPMEAISAEATEQIAKRLSKQTRDRLDDFMDNFTMPPEFAADPDFAPILF